MRRALLVALALTVASACGDHATSKAGSAETARPNRPRVTQAPDRVLAGARYAAVPDPELRGDVRTREPAAVLAEAHATFATAARRFPEVRSIEKASRDEIAGRKMYSSGEKLRIDNTYLITVDDGPKFSVRIAIGPLGGELAARTVVNTSKSGVLRVARARALAEVPVKGRYVVQLDEGMDPVNVERVVAGALGEILAQRTLAETKQVAGPDLLRPGEPPEAGARLSPHDRGRIGELRVLAVKVGRGSRSAVRELLALVDELGLGDGAPAAGDRRRLVTQALGDDAASLRALDTVWQPETRLSPDLRDQLAAVREDQRQRLARTTAAGNASPPLYALADARPAPGEIVSPERATELAREAARVRSRRSAETVRQLRLEAARVPAGRYPVIRDLQIGGGASVAARAPTTLLVDMRGRWQGDKSERIAQTANQLAGLKAAGVGDPLQFAGPDERVPVTAVRYWKDSIAAQGPVIDGEVTAIDIGERGTTTVLISPDDGGPQLRIEVEGNLVIATGFPIERIPGMPRGIPGDRAIDRIRAALQRLVDDPSSTVVQQRRARNVLGDIAVLRGLEHRPRQRELHLAQVRATLDRNGLATVMQAQASEAYQAVVAGETWHRLATEHPGRFILGDMANTHWLNPLATDHWVIGGLGGTGVSAAEIILAKNPRAHVTMVGGSPPDGLLENSQFTSVLQTHTDAVTARKLKTLFGIELPPGDGRFSLVFDVTLGVPTLDRRGNVQIVGDGVPPDGIPAGYDARSNPLKDARGYISAIGRDNQLPPVAAALWHGLVARGGRMTMIPMYDRGRRYTHYRLFAFDSAGQELRHIDVTGAASRYPPWELMVGTPDAISAAQRALAAASDLDAPPEGGNFDGGFVSSATQASRYARALAAGDPGFR